MSGILDFLTSEFAAFLLGSLLTVVVTWLIDKIRDRRYGGWNVELIYQGVTLVKRRITPRKLEEVLEEPADESVYVKGLISPYGRLRCDPIETEHLITIDHENKKLIVNLDHDPGFEPFQNATKRLAQRGDQA